MLNARWFVLVALVLQPGAARAQDWAAEPGEPKKVAVAKPVRLARMQIAPLAQSERHYWMIPGNTAGTGAAALADRSAEQAQPVAQAAPGIADNSFLLEEAYNQEYGVVQHISAFHRSVTTGDWAYSFTQEWPFNPAPRSQLSYTITGVSGGAPRAGGGSGDIFLNYRYQVLGGGDARVAFAPRASLLAPSGSSRDGRGAGGAGMQFNLPVSWQVAKKVVTHWNAGTTIVPRAKNPAGDMAATYGYSLGQSFILQASPRFNLMLETVFDHSQSVTAPGRAAWESSVVISPGFRWAHNFENGLQIVPGIAFPVEVGNAGRGNWGVFLYLSFEHPFGKRAP